MFREYYKGGRGLKKKIFTKEEREVRKGERGRGGREKGREKRDLERG